MAYPTREPDADMAAYRRAAEATSSRYQPPRAFDTVAPADGRRRQYVAAANHSKKTTPSAYDIACELDHRRAASYSTTSNTNSDHFSAGYHYRSQSHETPSSGWHQDSHFTASAESTSAQQADRKSRRYGCLTADQGTAACLPPHLQPSVYQRRSSEGSTVSTASTASNTDSPPAWSGSESESEATTPGSASPISPNSSLLLLSDSPSPERISPPQRTSSKVNPVAAAAAMSPSRPPRPQQQSAPIRPARPRAYSRPSRFQNTPIESPVPEEAEELADGRRISRASDHRMQQQQEQRRQEQERHWQQQQQQQQTSNNAPAPNLHQRRQQRQQMVAPTADRLPTRKPVPQTLSPLYPAPLQPQPPRQRHHAELQQPQPTQQQRLKASCSMPQLRNPAGPPPAMPLPPLPQITATSPFFPPTPTSATWSATAPASPTTASAAPPAAPLQPPPQPPSAMLKQQEYASGPATRKALPTSSTERTLKASSTAATITPETVKKAAPAVQEDAQMKQAQNITDAWESEFQRQRVFLKQFASPPEAPREQGRLLLSRTYRSLGNLRSHSKSQAQTSSSATQKTAGAGEAPRPSTAKSMRVFSGGRADEVPPVPALPRTMSTKKDLPAVPALPVSVFEDDSDDEVDGNDTVRRFMRNLFGRRTRSAEVHDASTRMAAATPPVSSARSASLGDAHTQSGHHQHHHHYHNHNHSSNSNSNTSGYHDRAKNQSTASSTLSMATTVGASTVASSTGTALTAQSSYSTDGESYGAASPSPRESYERPPSAAAKGQHLLGRMFVRRSN